MLCGVSKCPSLHLKVCGVTVSLREWVEPPSVKAERWIAGWRWDSSRLQGKAAFVTAGQSQIRVSQTQARRLQRGARGDPAAWSDAAGQKRSPSTLLKPLLQHQGAGAAAALRGCSYWEMRGQSPAAFRHSPLLAVYSTCCVRTFLPSISSK